MNKKRIGFLTTSGSFAAIMTAVIVAGVGFVSGGVLFNPGPLNAKAGTPLGGVTSHADLSNNCSSCHTAFWGQVRMADRCVACHADISTQWGDPATLHGNLHKSRPNLVCRNCHPEHRGPNASLTEMTQADVTHDAFGYALTAHVTKTDGNIFACADCHTNGYLHFDQTICATCHEQVKADFMQSHLQAYGKDCLGCHDGIDTYGHAFDHSLVAFQLTGKHAQVNCTQCHTGARKMADLKSTSRECYSCHAKDDAHIGQLGTDCASCHSTEGWVPSTYDHNLSIFKLTGKHTSAACTSCHVNNIFRGTPTDCYSCHAKDDAHAGDLGKICSSCHTTDGWLPATFDHNLSDL